MSVTPTTGGISSAEPIVAPASVRVIRTLGKGRAARAQLVEATFPDGSKRVCVEKVFAPGWLTRLIYRIAFLAPFAYQSNKHAILASFYRRKVAAAVIAQRGLQAEVAEPLYVRYDETSSAWVLAARFVEGRGICPVPVDATRIRRWLKNNRWFGNFFDCVSTASASSTPRPHATVAFADNPQQVAGEAASEIDELIAVMRGLEDTLGESGLFGSGWQVSPNAMVSTANLLRVGDHYCVVDLESGIPAVLVPRYVWQTVRRGSLIPFDDLDANRLREWFSSRFSERGGDDISKASADLSRDVDQLIRHTAAWKESEVAWLRRPWRLFRATGWRPYLQETRRRWEQQGCVDADAAESLTQSIGFAAALWLAGLVPTSLGVRLQKLVGKADARVKLVRFLKDRGYRSERVRRYRTRCVRSWFESGRVPSAQTEQIRFWLINRLLQVTTPALVHRWLVDRSRRRELATTMLLLLSSPTYQSYFGQRLIGKAIDRWEAAGRLPTAVAVQLRGELSAEHVRWYARGLGLHVLIKALGPLLLPAKVGGVAAFFASGSVWFLLPLLLTPALRSAVTLASAWSARHRQVPHGEALLAGLLPVLGSLAFPLQMFAHCPQLSTFLIRDAASRLGRSVPIYGGSDSRTEIACIRLSDLLVEALAVMADFASRVRLGFERGDMPAASEPAASPVARRPRTRLGSWLEQQSQRRIAAATQGSSELAAFQMLAFDPRATEGPAPPADNPSRFDTQLTRRAA